MPLRITIDRAGGASLTQQIHGAIRDAVHDGRLAAGARLPSWRDLAAQLGVARGTVRAAYERLADEQLVVGQGAAGTRVAERVAVASPSGAAAAATPLADWFPAFAAPPLTFQMGVPAQDVFPAKLWARIMGRSARAAAVAPVGYPDPRGHPDLRREIAAYLAVARGVRCTPAQVLVTAGYAGALGLAIHALRLEGRTAWLEDPGFPLTRLALGHAGITVAPVPVDVDGIDVAAGERQAPGAALAVVTPGQQAPLGMPMSLPRRLALLAWAAKSGAWIVEDDYLSELQLKGRAAPALASLDHDGQVLHAGSFSKTISPALRLGFLVVPPQLAGLFGDVAAGLAPAPAGATQLAVAAFMAEGHYLRHLRRMKRLYLARREALLARLRGMADSAVGIHATGGLAVRITLPDGADDVAIARRAHAFGLAPSPLSPWCAAAGAPAGLLLGVANLAERRLAADCGRLLDIVRQAG